MRNKSAVIAARGGSKRLFRKNVRIFAGKPLIAWVIEAALSSNCFQNVIVSTEDEEIASVSEKFGAWVPFKRPIELATDTASSMDVVLHTVSWLRQTNNYIPLAIALLQPTSPFLRAAHIENACRIFDEGGFTTLSSMRPIVERPEWMFKLKADNHAEPLSPKLLPLASNELPELYIENGAIYLVKTEYLEHNKSMYDIPNHGAMIMSPEDSLDIDTQFDWDFAETILSRRRAQNS